MRKYYIKFADMKNIPTAYYLPDEVEAEIERKDKVLCFLKSVILSGEPWTKECEETFQEALSKEE